MLALTSRIPPQRTSQLLFNVTYKECEDERIVASVFEASSPGLAGKDAILDVGFAHAVHRRIVLVATVPEGQVPLSLYAKLWYSNDLSLPHQKYSLN